MQNSDLEGIIVPLALAVVIGVTIGIERSVRGRPAGLRTYLLVCVSFAVIALLSESHFLHLEAGFRPDPARLAAGGLTGIGFLGAGVIVRSRFTVFGLTTAAGIWTVAVIGLTLGSRNYVLAVALYVITLGSLWLLRYLEALLPRDTFRQIILWMRGEGMSIEEAKRYFAQYRLELEGVTVDRNKHTQATSYTFILHSKRRDAFTEAFNDLLKRDDVQSAQLISQDSQEVSPTTADV